MTNSETKKFSQNASSSYHLKDKGTNVPKLRFKGYNDEWTEKTFDEIFKIIGNNTLSRDCLNYKHMGTKNIHYGDILVKYNTCIDEDCCEIPIINSEISLDKIPMENYLQQGDIVIADTAEDYTVGKTCEILNIHSKILSGLHTIPCRPKFHFAKGFLGHYLNSNKYHNRLIPLITGIKVSSINKREIKKTFVKFPTLPEQEKIASFLTLIDRKIAKQKELVELLKKYKRGLLSQIFSQKLRFKDDNGKWQKIKLEHLGMFLGGGTPSKNNLSYWQGNIPWISSSDISDSSVTDINVSRFISREAVDNSATKICPKSTICIVSRVGVGKLAISNCDICTSQDFINFINTTKNNAYFLAYYLKEIMKRKLLKTQGTSIKGITSYEIKNIQIVLPPIQIQNRIADILLYNDTLIKKYGFILGLLLKYKNGLLQQMFI